MTMTFEPILLTPAYRGGALTPWGGDRLKTLYGKDIPDEHTGEALEFSALPGLESRDPEGTPISGLIARCGADLLGSDVTGEVPLLLKLIDARQDLSVQVHPDDAYAARVEGKQGKTEAWIILSAGEGARIVYGLKQGVTLDELRDASERGQGVEDLLNYQPVRPGDVYFIPSGTVHAIGADIVLYEIQQSSDVTYRFYDWNRRDRNGNARELHLKKALDVVNMAFVPQRAAETVLSDDGRGTVARVLDTRYFGTLRYDNANGARLPRDGRRFGLLTAVTDGELRFEGGSLPLKAGRTALIPAACGDVCLYGGRFLYSYPVTERDQ